MPPQYRMYRAGIRHGESASADEAGSGIVGAGSTAHNNAVNTDRIGPARAENRRSHRRTVDASLPSVSAIRRCPHPAAACASAAPMTATASARRTKQVTGNNTCVTPHPEQRARRGRSRHRTPPVERILRGRP